MKAKIVQKSNSYKPEDMMVAHKAINAKWKQLREDLRLGKYTFDDLDKFRKEGVKIKYTVTEDKVEGYKKPIIKGYDITNPIKPEKPVIPVTGDPTSMVSLLMLLAAGAVLVPVSRRRKHQ